MNGIFGYTNLRWFEYLLDSSASKPESGVIRMIMLSSTAFLMLMLCATDAMKVSKPGADLLSPLHPDYLSKSLIGMKNSLIYGIRTVDALIVLFDQRAIEQIHDKFDICLRSVPAL
ncbi:unnamed protein product [Toxocara canis]|uniref:Secreted protein n=1 Tax=Toxocara canis TaxID=6265 RepID=A0A183VFU5_TOXCA|nr:unnamed protein product [Toxocara canis]